MDIKRLDCDSNGQDPLVISYQENRGDNCARMGISVPWCIGGLLFACLGAVLFQPDLISGPGKFEDALLNYKEIFYGLVAGTVAAILLSKIVSRKSSTQQECFYGFCAAVFLYGMLYALYLNISVSAGVATAVVCLIYLVSIGFRLLAFGVGWFKSKGVPDDAEMLEWPVYTILVPLYKERNVANSIIQSLNNLDYPRDCLDVKLLLEADDNETLDALEAAHVPDWMEILVVPDAQPRTKPRACNHGLACAKGEYLVIFDAEDKPEPDQLKKAVMRFDELESKNVVCIQASLAYHNFKQNLLTRLFAIEYNMWFTRFQPGLVKLGGPLPLGGTSNHFKISALKEVEGWDPYNVTEDCDLGVRLHAHGYKCDLLDSTTWEEANSRVGNWLRQRSRWIKGYMITHVVWFRHPLRLLFKIGPLGFCRFIMVVSSVGLLAVANPLLWAILLYWAIAVCHDLSLGYSFYELLATRAEIADRWSWPMLYLEKDEDPTWSMVSQVLFTLSCILFAANFLFVLIACIWGSRKGQRGLFWAALLSPFYWVLMSIASWKALWQLIVRPHYWEKTVHGLGDGEGEIPQDLSTETKRIEKKKDDDTDVSKNSDESANSDALEKAEEKSEESPDKDADEDSQNTAADEDESSEDSAEQEGSSEDDEIEEVEEAQDDIDTEESDEDKKSDEASSPDEAQPESNSDSDSSQTPEATDGPEADSSSQ